MCVCVCVVGGGGIRVGVGVGEGVRIDDRALVTLASGRALGTNIRATRPDAVWRQAGVKIAPDDTFHHYTAVEVAATLPPGYLGHHAMPCWRALVKQCAISAPVSETPASPPDE